MPGTGQARLVSIYVLEDAHIGGRPVYMAVLEMLRSRGAAAASVTRCIAGYDGVSHIHAAGVVALSADLPVKIEWIDTPERVDRLLRDVEQLVGHGLITVQDVTVVKWTSSTDAGVLDQPVTMIMSADVESVKMDASLGDVVSLLLRKGYRSVPILDADDRVVGIVTDGDLLNNTTLPIRLGLHTELTQNQVQADIDELQSEGRTVSEIMTMPVITVEATTSVRAAGALMVEHSLKRLPVVDRSGRLVGIVSRVDMLHALRTAKTGPAPEADAPLSTSDRSIAALMNPNAPYVTADATLEEVMQALERSRQQRLVVVDEARHVAGVITDGDLMRRSMYGRTPSLRRRLRGLITGVPAVPLDLPAGTERASDLMTTPVVTIELESSISDALGLMLAHKLKRLPVVDSDGRLVGVLGRSSVLRGLLHESAPSQ